MWNSLHKRLWHIFKLIDAISIVLLCEIEDMNENPEVDPQFDAMQPGRHAEPVNVEPVQVEPVNIEPDPRPKPPARSRVRIRPSEVSIRESRRSARKRNAPDYLKYWEQGGPMTRRPKL